MALRHPGRSFYRQGFVIDCERVSVLTCRLRLPTLVSAPSARCTEHSWLEQGRDDPATLYARTPAR
eukprot:2762962-Prymnesium_polylepis.1